nr:helix-turn-helix domain-containing protein [Halomicroarcula sp. SHR3]
MGYYDQPRGATQADVAEVLDCSPQTAGTHLRKAESKVMRAVLAAF